MKRFGKKLNGNQLGVGMLMWLIAFATLTCVTGITYAVLKNDQVQVARDIRRMNEEIASCELTKEYYRARTEPLISRISIKEKLKADKSNLQPIDAGACDDISPASGSDLASTKNP